MKRALLFAALGLVGLALVVALRESWRNTVISSVNRRRVNLDRTGNRTNDIPSQRGELPVDLRQHEQVDLR
jgi:hypothetical protein